MGNRKCVCVACQLLIYVVALSLSATLPPQKITEIKDIIAKLPNAPVLTMSPGQSNGGCRNNVCGQYRYKQILSTYQGLFQTSYNLSRLRNIYGNEPMYEILKGKSEMPRGTVRYTDSSLCCSTQFGQFPNSSMTYIYDEERHILQLHDHDPPSYQYIPHAKCVYDDGCSGKCMLQHQIISLLVLDGKGVPRFDAFSVPGYCTCKNVYH